MESPPPARLAVTPDGQPVALVRTHTASGAQP